MSGRRASPELPLFATDDELARALFSDAACRKAFLDQLPIEERKGFPRKHPIWNARYWPAVRAYLDRQAGLRQDAAPSSWDGKENWDDERPGRSRPRTSTSW